MKNLLFLLSDEKLFDVFFKETQQLDEGFGDFVKNKIAGTERWMQNKGMNFAGMGQSAGGYTKQNRDLSRAQIQTISAGQTAIPDEFKINTIQNNIKKIDPQFPNCKDKQKFLNCVAVIANVYSKIKKIYHSGNLEKDTANSIIDSLRKFVHHNLDAELMGAYSHFNEHLSYDSSDFLNQLLMLEATITGNPNDSSTIKNLENKSLPNILNNVGKVLGVVSLATYLSGVIGDKLYQSLLKHPTIAKTWNEEVLSHSNKVLNINCENKDAFNIIKDLLKQDMPYHNGNWTVGDLQALMKDSPDAIKQLDSFGKIPGNILNHLTKISSGDPNASLDSVLQTINGSNKFNVSSIMTLKSGKIAIKASAGLLLKQIVKRVITTIGTTIAGGALTTSSIGAGVVATTPIFAAGAAVAGAGGALISYLRSKGLKDSRASVLKNTLQTLQNV